MRSYGGTLGVAFAFGLTVVTMAYAVGHVSGGHFNPAITSGCGWASASTSATCCPTSRRRWSLRSSPVLVLLVIANGLDGFDASTGEAGSFASNGYGDFSPGGYNLFSCIVTELVMTAFFVIVIMGVTDDRAPKGCAPMAIGLALTLIHLISIPVTNTSVNPARSIGVGLFAGSDAIEQLWMFIIVPLTGGALGALAYLYVIGGAPHDVAGPGQVPAGGPTPF